MMDRSIKLGKYTLGETLGTGGFGTVYKANDPSGRTVAIKVLKPGWNDDPGAIERFRREAQVAGELFHSRIATIIDFDEADGRLYLVMRDIDGIPLNELIKQKGRLSWEETIQILEQVAEGLDYAHQRGLVHRDIKPANILVSEKDGAVITDFGLVKAADVSGMSTTGVMLGTPHYIAPEIWEGKSATPQTDIYSLACVAYEMLTGLVLFEGKSPPEVMTRHIRGNPPLPSDWDNALKQVFLSALDPEIGNRFLSVIKFVDELKNSRIKASTQNHAFGADHVTVERVKDESLTVADKSPTDNLKTSSYWRKNAVWAILALFFGLGLMFGLGLLFPHGMSILDVYENTPSLTNSPIPSNTIMPTNTPTKVSTVTPSRTPTFTLPPTLTYTPTFTVTPTITIAPTQGCAGGNVSGNWNGFVKWKNDGTKHPVSLSLMQTGCKVEGLFFWESHWGAENIYGSVSDGVFSFKSWDSSFGGPLTISGNEMTGKDFSGYLISLMVLNR